MTKQDDDRLQRLWAPWRLDYVKSLQDADERCIFCAPPDEVGDRDRHIVVRRPGCLALLNRYPYNNGHLLVAPARHVAALADLDDDEMTALTQLIRDLVALLDQTLQPQGYNIGLNLGRAAGAGILEHLHVHIVPRWAGDTNFMPVTAGAKVIPESLDALWQLLRARLAT